jgi:hypothetical protein
MLLGWTRAIVLVALAALIGNAHCFGNCVSAACGSPKSTSSGCHHQKPSSQDSAGCSHQHSELAAPETGIAKINIAAPAAILPALTSDSATVAIELQFVSLFNTTSPPGSPGSRISVLRI